MRRVGTGGMSELKIIPYRLENHVVEKQYLTSSYDYLLCLDGCRFTKDWKDFMRVYFVQEEYELICKYLAELGIKHHEDVRE
jgi:hypothetical protein